MCVGNPESSQLISIQMGVTSANNQTYVVMVGDVYIATYKFILHNQFQLFFSVFVGHNKKKTKAELKNLFLNLTFFLLFMSHHKNKKVVQMYVYIYIYILGFSGGYAAV
jgi:hypothetical protein